MIYLKRAFSKVMSTLLIIAIVFGCLLCPVMAEKGTVLVVNEEISANEEVAEDEEVVEDKEETIGGDVAEDDEMATDEEAKTKEESIINEEVKVKEEYIKTTENNDIEEILEIQSVGESIKYFFKDLEANYPNPDPAWNPAGIGTENWSYSEISPIGMIAIKSTSSGMMTYRTGKVGDYLRFNFYVPQSGKYNLNIGAFKNIGGGLADIYIDDIKIEEFDFYADPAIPGIQTINSENVILTKGNHVLSFDVTGTNGPRYYYIYLFSFELILQELIADQTPEVNPSSVNFIKKPVELQEDIELEMIPNGNLLVSIKNGDVALTENEDYLLYENSITIKKEYLALLEAGETKLIFCFDNGSEIEVTFKIKDEPDLKPEISPVTSTFDRYLPNQSDIDVELILNDNTLVTIKNNGTDLLRNTHYTLSDNIVTIKKEYLKNQPIGNINLEFSFSGGSNVVMNILVKDTTPAETNLVPNPGFEDHIINENAPDLWRFGKAGTGNWEYDSEIKFEGDKSVKLINNAYNDRAYFFYQYVPVKPGSKYEYSAYYKTEEMFGEPFIQLTWYSSAASSGFIQAVPIVAEKEASDWKKISGVLDAPNNASFAYVSVQLRNNTGIVWFDNVELRELIQNSTIDPVIMQYNKNSSDQEALDITVNYNNNELISIRNGDKILELGEDFTLEGNFITIKKEYLETLNVGTEYLVFEFSQGNNQILTIVVNDSSGLSTSNETFDKNINEQKEIEVTMNLNGNLLTGIFHNDYELILGEDYNLISENTVVIKKEYLKSLPTKIHVFRFCFTEGNDATMTITVIDTTTPIQINLVSNPSFENGDTVLDAWTFDNGNTSGSMDQTSDKSKDGSKSIRLSILNDSDTSFISQNYISINEGATYLFDAFYITENFNGDVKMKIDWYSSTDTSGHMESYAVNGLSNTTEWKKLFTELAAPSGSKYVTISLGIEDGSGNVWFDSVSVRENNILKNPRFINSGETPDSWYFNNFGSNGSFEIINDNEDSEDVLVGLKTNDDRDISTLNQSSIQVNSEKMYTIKTNYKIEGQPEKVLVSLFWYDINGNMLRKDDFECIETDGWNYIEEYAFAPLSANSVTIELRSEKGIGIVWFKDAELKQALINSAGEIIPVADVEDITEQLSPNEFWSNLPSIDLQPPSSSVWTQNILRNFFFGPTENGRSTYFSLNTPSIIKERDENIPILNGLLGSVVDPSIPLAIAGDIAHRPFVKDHGNYSNKYYPRRMHDYIATDYNPSYVLTGDDKYADRAKELLAFLEMSQWTDEGENEFTSMYFPSEYSTHPEWAGGWDYLFDWRWTDGYGYKWDLHEPDHHVNSQIASTLINSYEIYKDETYLNMARKFLYNQIPRYGFHKGTWNNHTYYWTEYNPTGTSLGNRSDDATDNVIALVAEACAKVGFYEQDPVLKTKYLEMARGLLWYMVREYETDGRWFYDGAENQINPGRFAISHDAACIVPSFVALTYLYKAGVDISCFEDTFSRIEDEYARMWPLYERKSYIKAAKIYDGNPELDATLTFSTFALITSDGLGNIRFQDKISEDFVIPESLDVRISKIIPPDQLNPNWVIDQNNDIYVSVTPEQLENGIILPFMANKGDILKISYDLDVKEGFSRENAVDNDSILSAWAVDKNNTATFARITTGTSGILQNSHTLPLRTQTKINSENFLSFGARMAFPFEEETSAILIQTPAPEPIEYEHDENWGNINAKRYIYPVESVIPEINSSGQNLSSDVYNDLGRVYNSAKISDYIEFEIEVFSTQQEYNVISNYAKASNRGIVSMYINGVEQGNEVDLYKLKDSNNNLDIPQEVTIPQGSVKLEKGRHSVKFVVKGKNPASTGYAIGLYNVIILEPLNYIEPTPSSDATLSEIKVDGVKLSNFSKNITEYSIKLPYNYSSIPKVTALATDENAVINIIDASQIPGTTIIEVTAEDGTIKIYGINFLLGQQLIDDEDDVKDDDNGGKDNGDRDEDNGNVSEVTETQDDNKDNYADEGSESVTINTIEEDGTVLVEGKLTEPIKAVLAVESLNEAKQKNINEIKIVSFIAKMSINLNSLMNILKDGSEKVEILMEVATKEELPLDIVLKTDNKPVYKFDIYADGERITNFKGMKAIKITIPYELSVGEDPNKIVVYYINDEGVLEVVKNCLYNVESQSITFMTDHLSLYTAKQAVVSFKDVKADSWSKQYIDALAAREIILGKTPEKFDPFGNITRAEFITLIMRTLDLLDSPAEEDFEDVKIGDWCYDAVSSAKKLGIVSGIGNNKFGKDLNITRQEMAVMLNNAIKAANLKITSDVETKEFSDSKDIADYAKESVVAMQKVGIFEGTGNNMFLPVKNATREEAAKVIYILFLHSIRY